jgi:hypothetical protein
MSNRTLAEMRLRVRRLAHDLKTATAEKTYPDGDVDVALSDSLRELTDRLLADEVGRWALLTVGEDLAVTTAAEAAQVELPEECLRLEWVQWLGEEGDWLELPRLGLVWPSADVRASMSRQTSVVLGFRTVAGTVGGARGWRPNEDGLSVRLWPWDEGEALTIRLVFLGAPGWGLTATSRLGLPEGADELLELMAGDKLTADEPRDEKRMVLYRARLDGRYGRWVAGRARGKIDRGQLVAGAE